VLKESEFLRGKDSPHNKAEAAEGQCVTLARFAHLQRTAYCADSFCASCMYHSRVEDLVDPSLARQ
jgi:hypothetical protein